MNRYASLRNTDDQTSVFTRVRLWEVIKLAGILACQNRSNHLVKVIFPPIYYSQDKLPRTVGTSYILQKKTMLQYSAMSDLNSIKFYRSKLELFLHHKIKTVLLRSPSHTSRPRV